MPGNAAILPVLLAARSGYDVREMTFQTVVDKILLPAGVKIGGFPEDIFIDLTEEEQQSFMCNICYLIANDCRLCDNKHVFCQSCIFAWSMTYGENSKKCPMCRCDQPAEYHTDKQLQTRINEKRVRCPAEGCSFKAPLHIFLIHSHGKVAYSNADVNYSQLRDEQARLTSTPPVHALSGNDETTNERAASIREQLLQGRLMIHQMMLLMHLEMQLRQQALTSYQEAQDPTQRLQRLDDIMALNEQLNEVGVILSTLLSVPLSRVAQPSTVRGERTSYVLGNRRNLDADDEEDDDSVPDESSDDEAITSDDNMDTIRREPTTADVDTLLSLQVLDRNDQSAAVQHRNIIVGRRRLTTASPQQPLGSEISPINTEIQQQIRPVLPSPLPTVRASLTGDQPRPMLTRRQELQSSFSSSRPPVDVQIDEIHPLSDQVSRQSQTALPPIVQHPEIRSAVRLQTPQTVVAPIASSVSEHSSNARSSIDSQSRLGRSTMTSLSESRDGPVTEPWPATSGYAELGVNQTALTTSSQNRNSQSDNLVRTRQSRVTARHTEPITSVRPVNQLNAIRPGRPDAVQGDQSSTDIRRRSTSWRVARNLVGNVTVATSRTSRPPLTASRPQMIPLSNPSRGSRSNGGNTSGPSGRVAESTTSQTLRPRRRSEIMHDLLFPSGQREN